MTNGRPKKGAYCKSVACDACRFQNQRRVIEEDAFTDEKPRRALHAAVEKFTQRVWIAIGLLRECRRLDRDCACARNQLREMITQSALQDRDSPAMHRGISLKRTVLDSGVHRLAFRSLAKV